MQWRDLAGRLYGLACQIDQYRDAGRWIDPEDPILQELRQLSCEVLRPGWWEPTDGGAPPSRKDEGRFSFDRKAR